MTTTYDRIGAGYPTTRRPDPRIAARIMDAIGDAASVLNVGAGTGSYEPMDRRVVAVEPSETMIRQRRPGSAPVIQATAEALPFIDRSFDVALAVLTVHHWTDPQLGLAEMRRVAARRIVLTWDEDVWESFWLVREYLSSIKDLDRRRAIPIDDLASSLGGGRAEPVMIPHDCIDGFHGAYWRRPAAYLDPVVRSGISTYALMRPADRDAGLRRLASDLDSGAWAERHRDLLEVDEIDLGYRLVIA